MPLHCLLLGEDRLGLIHGHGMLLVFLNFGRLRLEVDHRVDLDSLRGDGLHHAYLAALHGHLLSLDLQWLQADLVLLEGRGGGLFVVLLLLRSDHGCGLVDHFSFVANCELPELLPDCTKGRGIDLNRLQRLHARHSVDHDDAVHVLENVARLHAAEKALIGRLTLEIDRVEVVESVQLDALESGVELRG